MPQVPIELKNGIATSVDECRAPQGFVAAAAGVWYKPEDPDRLWVLPGEVLVGTLPTHTGIKGMAFLQYDNAANKLVLLDGTTIYEGTADSTISTWVTAKDQSSPTPLAFSWGGSRIKAVHDGTNRWALISGSGSEFNLIRNSDGAWRRLGILPPGAISLTPAPTYPTDPITPDLHNPSEVPRLWTAHTNAVDGEDSTYASNTINSVSTSTSEWAGNVFGFSGHGATVTTSQSISVKLRISNPFAGIGEIGWSTIQLDVSYRIGGTTYGPITISYRYTNQTDTLSIPVPDGATIDSIEVTATSRNYPLGHPPVGEPIFCYAIHELYEITLITAASSNPVTAGDYYYAVTAIYKETTTSGDMVVLESDPCTPQSVTMNGTTHTSVTVTLPSINNTRSMGFDPANLYWRIYRSVVSGTYPDLGLIGEVPSSATTYADPFTVGPAELGDPTIPSIEVGGLDLFSNTPPPVLRDAALYRGALVGIDELYPRELVYSSAGYPEYFPSIQRFSLLPSDKNDELRGIEVLNDSILVLSRSRIFRLKDLPFAIGSGFDLSGLSVDIISSSEGLVSPLLYCKAQSWRGDSLLFWVSDTGIWFTDGFYPAERGLGCQKVTKWLDWDQEVDTTRLSECRLTYDPKMQVVWFDYYAPNGDHRSLLLHLAAPHWLDQNSNETATYGTPKITGPHTCAISHRACGTNVSEVLTHWTVRAAGTLYRYTFSGPWNINPSAVSVVTHWIQPGTSRDGADVAEGLIYHSDWGQNQSATIRVEARRDYSGITTIAHKPGVGLAGARGTRFWVNRSGNSFKVLIYHTGGAVGALGPLFLDITPAGEALER